MTAKDLIELLQQVDPESEVYIDLPAAQRPVCYKETGIYEAGDGEISLVIHPCYCDEEHEIAADTDTFTKN